MCEVSPLFVIMWLICLWFFMYDPVKVGGLVREIFASSSKERVTKLHKVCVDQEVEGIYVISYLVLSIHVLLSTSLQQ